MLHFTVTFTQGLARHILPMSIWLNIAFRHPAGIERELPVIRKTERPNALTFPSQNSLVF